jgi:hypothetical protein
MRRRMPVQSIVGGSGEDGIAFPLRRLWFDVKRDLHRNFNSAMWHSMKLEALIVAV